MMVQMPTGTGKTVLLAEVIRQVTPPRPSQGEGDYPHTETRSFTEGGVLIVAHRRELIEQIKETLRAVGIAQEQVRVESIQRLARRMGHTEITESTEIFSILTDP